MFSTLIDCGDSLQKNVDQLADKQQTIEVRDVFAWYSTNVIASVVFGIDCIRDPNSEFRRHGKKIFEMTFIKGITAAITFLSPNLMRSFRIRATDKSVQDFMTTVVEENLEFREKNEIVWRDFFQLLVQLRKCGTIAQNDDEWKMGKCLTLNEMTAQSFIFFAGGFETTSTIMSFCLYELCKAQEIQRNVHAEIGTVLKKYNGKLTNDSITEMKYLDNCIDG